MIITCEECGISFNLDESLLKPSGSKVRCSKCKTVFTAYPPEPEIKPVPPKTDQSPASESDNDLDFSDLEEMLDSDDSIPDESEKKDESGMKTTEVDDDIDEEIDIAGLEDMLDSSDDLEVPSKDDLDLDLSIDSDKDTETEEALSAKKESDDLDLDISFDTDDDAEPDMIEEEIAAEDDLDLSLESDEEVEVETAGASDELEDLDLDLDLDLSLESDEAGEEEAAGAVDELEDLDLDLSLESDEAGEEAVAVDEEGLEDLELELEGVDEEGALESDLLSTKTVSEVEDDSDDLNLELDIDEDAGEKDEEEIDLAELEQTLEMELLSPADGDEDSGKEIENVELELSDDENITDDVDEELDIADDADVSDIEQMLEMDSEEEAEQTSDEMELEFDVDGAGDKKEPVFESEADDDAHTSLDLTAGGKKEKPKSRPDSDIKPVEKKKISTSLVILIVFLLLIGAAVGGYFLLVSQGVKLPSLNIPYISDLLNPDAKKDLGMVETVQSMVKSEFIDNTTLGKLFVITGYVKNTTTKACHSVKVTAKLYATGKKLAKSKTVYAGTKMSKEELSTIDLETLNKNMANPLSSTGQPIRILPGGQIPFMIVIPNLPDNLEEYKVMVTESVME